MLSATNLLSILRFDHYRATCVYVCVCLDADHDPLLKATAGLKVLNLSKSALELQN